MAGSDQVVDTIDKLAIRHAQLDNAWLFFCIDACHIHVLVRYADNVNRGFFYCVKDEVTSFGEATVALLYVVSSLPRLLICSQPFKAIYNRADIGFSLFQIPFNQRMKPDIFEVLSR